MSTDHDDKVIRFPTPHEADGDCGDAQPAGGFPPVVNDALGIINASLGEGGASFVIVGITPMRDGILTSARFAARMYIDPDMLEHVREHIGGVIESMFQAGQE